MKLLTKIFIIFFLILSSVSYADEVPVIVIAPGKTPQSISTVGSSVVVLDEKFFKKKQNEFFGRCVVLQLYKYKLFSKWWLWCYLSNTAKRFT